MIELDRKKDSRWIFQKNVSSKRLITSYLDVIKDLKDCSDKEAIKKDLTKRGSYKGRKENGSLSTMGVRFSEMCFYMFGYKDKKDKSTSVFVPTKTTLNILEDSDSLAENMLVNLFSIQYPHPYSKTSPDFSIYAGRLIIKLLTEDRIDKKLYMDEFVWFLPFLKNIDAESYEILICSILEYRKCSYEKKKLLFESVWRYDDVFSNCLHEFNYYFRKIFESFQVIESVPDSNHNQGKVFHFKHGKGNTRRHDGIDSRKSTGYIQLKKKLLIPAQNLLKAYSAFDNPIKMSDSDIFTRSGLIAKLYCVLPLRYLSVVHPGLLEEKYVSEILENMIEKANTGSVDGKEFEESLKPAFKLFDRIINCEILSGAGKTDLLCAADIDGCDNGLIKFNIEAKSRGSYQNINVKRIIEHMKETNAEYCIIVANRFTPSTKRDIRNEKIVAIEVGALASYLSKECTKENDYLANFNHLHSIVVNNLGHEITYEIEQYVNEEYGFIEI